MDWKGYMVQRNPITEKSKLDQWTQTHLKLKRGNKSNRKEKLWEILEANKYRTGIAENKDERTLKYATEEYFPNWENTSVLWNGWSNSYGYTYDTIFTNPV